MPFIDTEYLKGSNGTGPAVLAQVETNRLVGATTLDVNTVSKWNGKVIVTVGTLLPSGLLNPATITEFRGRVVGADIIIDSFEPGFSDIGNTAGQVAIIKQTTGWANTVAAAIAELQGAFSGPLVNKGVYDNIMINGASQVAQRPVQNITTGYQYGQVDRYAVQVTGTAVSAGTIIQAPTPAISVAPSALKLNGLTVTGTGVARVRYRVEAKDAVHYKNLAASFSALVRHDVGTNVNYTIIINKPTVADNFASVTNIATSSAQVVATATTTLIKLENINSGNLGDVSNGLEIIIEAAVGAVTLKNLEFTQFLFSKGATIGVFVPRPYQIELEACQRYFLDLSTTAQAATYQPLGPVFVGGGTSWALIATPTVMRTLPTPSYNNLLTRYGGGDFNWSTCVAQAQNGSGIMLRGVSTGSQNGNSGVLASSDGILRLDAEL